MTTAVTTTNRDLVLAGPVGSLDAYIQAVGSIPVLSKEDEHALAVRFREAEDLDAARELVMAHLRFVVHIAKGYTGYGLPLMENDPLFFLESYWNNDGEVRKALKRLRISSAVRSSVWQISK